MKSNEFTSLLCQAWKTGVLRHLSGCWLKSEQADSSLNWVTQMKLTRLTVNLCSYYSFSNYHHSISSRVNIINTKCLLTDWLTLALTRVSDSSLWFITLLLSLGYATATACSSLASDSYVATLLLCTGKNQPGESSPGRWVMVSSDSNCRQVAQLNFDGVCPADSTPLLPSFSFYYSSFQVQII